MPALSAILNRAPKPKLPARVNADLRGVTIGPTGILGAWPLSDDAALPWVTDDEALGLPVLGAFLEIGTALMTQMPLRAYQTSTAERVTAPPILENPNPGRTYSSWIECYFRDVALHGNYVAVLGPPGDDGLPDMLYPVPTDAWSVIPEGNNGAYKYQIGTRTYWPNQVLHVKRNVCSGDLIGRGILSLYRDLIATSVAAERWSATYFHGGAVPPAHIEHPNPDLPADQAAVMKLRYNEAVRRHEAIVTPAGVVVHALDSNAENAQLTDTRRLNMLMLAMAVGIPPALIGLDAPSLTYRNITDVLQQFLTTTIMGYLVPLEEQLSLQCLPPGQRAAFSTNAVLRPDLESRVRIASQGLQSGLFTPDEARAYFDLGGPMTDPLGDATLSGV